MGIGQKKSYLRFAVGLTIGGILVAGSLAHAADDDDEFFQSGTRTSIEKVREKNYPGARDEQSLEVQPSLSQPSRSPDATSSAASEEDRPVTAPTSD